MTVTRLRDDAYLRRKAREISVINGCLAAPLDLAAPRSVAEAIDRKFQLAGSLRAEQSLDTWAITETARPEVRRWECGAFEFSFGYQRADLEVRGPPIYADAEAVFPARAFQRTLYTGSGMSAIASVFSALRAGGADLEVLVPRGCYGETRELLDTLAPTVRIALPGRRRRHGQTTRACRRVLLVDSSVRADFFHHAGIAAADIDFVVYDTTCFWRTSSKIQRITRWTLRAGVPLVRVRSHAKLDCLGIEYGRLGSIVFTARRDVDPARLRSCIDLARATSDSIRLFGAAPIPAHFPPFAGLLDYASCSVERTASMLRNTRFLARRLRASARGPSAVTTYQHGLYFTLSPRDALAIRDVKEASAALCGALSEAGLPVRHAGSFGFDFTAVEWFPDPLRRRNVIRIAPGDLPASMVERIGAGIERWWRDHGAAERRTPETIALAAD